MASAAEARAAAVEKRRRGDSGGREEWEKFREGKGRGEKRAEGKGRVLRLADRRPRRKRPAITSVSRRRKKLAYRFGLRLAVETARILDFRAARALGGLGWASFRTPSPVQAGPESAILAYGLGLS